MKKLLLTLALIFLPLGVTLAETLPQADTSPTKDIELMPETLPQADTPPTEDIALISPETQINYQELQKLLAQGNWRKANDETYNLVLKIASRDTQGWISMEDINKLACSDLKIIDNLWTQYSQGRFGWSAQFPIFLETKNRPGKLTNDAAYEVFGDRVGWRTDGSWIIFKESLTYDLNAPQGHLPSLRNTYDLSGGRLTYTMLTKRIEQCHIVP